MKNIIKSSGTLPKGTSKVIPIAGKPKSKEMKSGFALSNAQKRLDHLEATKNIHLPL